MCNRSVNQAVLSSEGSTGEEYSSKLTQITDKIHVLAAVELRTPASS